MAERLFFRKTILGMSDPLRTGFSPIRASDMHTQAQKESRTLLLNRLNPPPIEEAPATLPNSAMGPTLISQLDHLSVEQRLHLLEIDARAFGLGYTKRQRRNHIRMLSERPEQIETALATLVGRMLKPTG